MGEHVKAKAFLDDPERLTHDSKKGQKRKADSLQSRAYDIADYEGTDDRGKTKMPYRDCTYKVVDGLPTGPANTAEAKRNGTAEMYHFRCHPMMPKMVAATRRIPCLCAGCKKQLSHKWEDKEEDTSQQRMFQKAEDGCYFDPIMGDLNDWHIHHNW